MKSVNLRKFFQKMHTHETLLICIQKLLNNMFIQRPQIPIVPKKQLIIILLHLGKMSQIVKTRL